MPPGPPVLQTVVAEVYGPDAETRRQVAADLTQFFDEAEGIVDVDNYMAEPYRYWRFDVDTEKAVRLGISVDTINRNLAMAMGGFRLGDVKRGVVQEPTYIVLQVPLANRAEIGSLASLPIQSELGGQVPLGELGRFVLVDEDPIIYHKDLRPMEYVVGEMEGGSVRRSTACWQWKSGWRTTARPTVSRSVGCRVVSLVHPSAIANPASNGPVNGRSPTRPSATWGSPSWRRWCSSMA
jgi:multidrug efflux pump subunit AcrB